MCADRHPSGVRVRIVLTRPDRTIALSLAVCRFASIDVTAAGRPTPAIDFAVLRLRGRDAP